MSIRLKLLIGIFAIALVASISGVLGYFTTQRIADSFQGDEKRLRELVSASNDVTSHIKRAETHIFMYVALGDPSDRQTYEARFASVLEALSVLDEKVHEPEGRSILNRIQSDVGRFQTSSQTLLSHYDEASGSQTGSIAKDNLELFHNINESSGLIRKGGLKMTKFFTDFLNRQESITASSEVTSFVKRAEVHLLIGLITGSEEDISKFALRTSSMQEQIEVITKRTRNREAGTLTGQLKQLGVDFRKSGEALVRTYRDKKRRGEVFDLSEHRNFLRKFYSYARLIRLNASSLMDINIRAETSRKTEVLNEAAVLKNRMLSISLVTLAMTLLIGLLVARSISGPIQALKKATEEVARGNLDITIKDDSSDELGQLATSFMSMVNDLRRYETVVMPAMDYMDNILKTMHDALIVVSSEGRIETANRASTILLEYPEEDLVGRPFESLFVEKRSPIKGLVPDDRDDHASSLSAEAWMVSRLGRIIPVFFSATAMFDSEDGFTGYVCSAVDITERKESEEALDKSEKRFRTFFEESLDTVYFTTLEGRIVECNPAGQDLLDAPSLEVLKELNLVEVIYPDKEKRRLFSQNLEEKGYVKEFQSTFTTAAGNKKTILNTATLVRDKNGKPTGYQGIIRDISVAITMESALREVNSTLTALFSASPLAIVVADLNGLITLWNPAAEEMFGWTENEVLGKPLPIIPEEREEEFQKFFEMASLGKRILARDVVRRRKNGSLINLSLSTSPMMEGNFVMGVVAIFADFTRRKQAEDALRETSARYRAVVQDMPALVCRIDKELSLTFVNKAFCSFFKTNWEDLVGKNIHEVIYEQGTGEDKESYSSLDQVNPLAARELKISQDGSERWLMRTDRALVDLKGEVTEYQSVFSDITELKLHEEEAKRLEEQIQHTQKLESLGVLAGGIAHDFNNILMGIMGNVSLLQMKLDDESPLKKNIDRIEKAAQRAAELTNQMLAYSGRGKFVITRTDMSTLVKEMTELLSTGISKGVKVNYKLSEELPYVEADTAQIQQLLMNLITNASDAAENSGTVTITTSVENCEPGDLVSRFVAEEHSGGRYSCLEIKDTGSGMEEEIIERIFEPFFTTKDTGRGLGLAAALGIVKGHHGSIRVRSQPGKGTSVKIFLPYSDGTAPEPEKRAEPVLGQQKFEGTVLVVDDEESVREVAKMMLELLGFDVLTAEDGVRGLETYRENSDRVSLVLLDMTMPGMTGDVVLENIFEINGSERIILSSGYTEEEITATILNKYPQVGFIQKPYRPEQLIATIIKALDGSSA